MRLIALLIALILPLTALAVAVDDSPLPDQAQEQKARNIMAGIRCLVCQNQSIEDSNAPLAKDLRQIVREQVASGKSPDDVRAYLVTRYGDWILLKPPFNSRTFFLWVFPPVLLLGALAFVLMRARAKPNSAETPIPLSREEEDRLAAILSDKSDSAGQTTPPSEGASSS